MDKLFRNMPIFRRLVIAFIIATAIPGIVIVLLGAFYFNSLEVRDQAVRTSFDAQSTASQQEINLERMNALLQTRHTQIFASLFASQGGHKPDSSLDASSSLIEFDITARIQDFAQTLNQYQSSYELATSSNMSTIRDILVSDNPGTTLISDQQSALTGVTQTLWPHYQALQQEELYRLSLLQQREAKGPLTFAQAQTEYANDYQVLFDANKAFLNLRNSWQNVTDNAVAMGKAVTAVGPSQTQPVLISTALALLFTILAVSLIGYILNRTITVPLRRLATLTKRIARGDTSARSNIGGRDEIYMVALSMNSMLDSIVRLIQDAQARHDVLQAQVEKLVSEVSGVAEGDLRIQAEVTIDALGVLADSFNYMVEELSGLIVRVKSVAYEVKNSTAMTYERMAQLVMSADNQINRISEAAANVTLVADSTRLVAERAEVLHTIATQARHSAHQGRGAIVQAIEGMDRIQTTVQDTSAKVQVLGERSREINNIVEVISSIAYQTNRLSLDAAIQAAMAGENGKGFAAVAADIRRLAELSKGQASMISRIVRSVGEDINAVAGSMQDTERETLDNSRLTHQASEALESIFSVVEKQASEIEGINQMAVQQLQTSRAVVDIMQNVSDATRQSSTSTREVSHLMERLAWLADQLLTSVGAFKLRDNENYLKAPAYPAPYTTVREVAPDARRLRNGNGASRALNAPPQYRPDGRGTRGGWQGQESTDSQYYPTR